jgi:DNA mismatch endonuclease (patch repair protein)
MASSGRALAVMKGTKSKDTAPELALRRAVWALGMRYRVHGRPLPGLRRTADLLFAAARVAVFSDGCFWHGCPEHHVPSKSSARWWADKIAGNRARDADTDRRLADAGWTSVRVWEHEDPHAAALRVSEAVADARRRLASGRCPTSRTTR